MLDPFAFLFGLAAVGALIMLAFLGVRHGDQRRKDVYRNVIIVRFPRKVSGDQVLGVVRSIIGVAPARVGLMGRASVALEVVGTAKGITHRLRVPENVSSYLISQLRAAIPGLAVEIIKTFRPEQCIRAIELGRLITETDLAVRDSAAVSQTILAAASDVRPGEAVVWQIVLSGGLGPRPTQQSGRRHKDGGVVGVAIRIGASSKHPKQAQELVNRMRRAALSVSAPGARLVQRSVMNESVLPRIARAATPSTSATAYLTPEETAALWAAPIGAPLIPGLTLGGSPQLPADAAVHTPDAAVKTVNAAANGTDATANTAVRVLGRSTVNGRSVAQPVDGAKEHTLILGPTGVGKSWLAARLLLDDVTAGRGALLIDPKGSTAELVLERLDEHAIGRTVVIDLTDEDWTVPLPLLAADGHGIPELAADTIVGLLRHRYRDLGPRSSDLVASSLYAVGRTPEPNILDLLRLWSDAAYRASVTNLVRDDPVLESFFGWFNGLNAAERSLILAAPMNKVRPLLQRASMRNVLAAPHATFSLSQALRERLLVMVILREGLLGSEATTLVGQVVLTRLWAAVQARRQRSFYPVTVDEAPRFLDQPTDVGDVLARSREYGVGMTLIGQTLRQFPESLREVALNSARTKIAFGTSANDAKRLAKEFGPPVEADFFTGLAKFEAIGAVSLGGTVSRPFTFLTEALGPATPGRAEAVLRASRERFGIPRTEVEAAIKERYRRESKPLGPIGRRRK
jgi:hypothetical protein